jgi:hypothetical protein
MSEDLELNSGIRLGVAAALGRQYADDLRSYVPNRARTFEQAMPDATEVLTKGFFKKEVVGVAVTFAKVRYTFQCSPRGGVAASRTRMAAGIALKTEELSMEEAIAELSENLEALSEKNQSAHTALSNLLGT